MRSLSVAKPKERISEAFDEAFAIAPSVVFAFAAPSLLRDETALKALCAAARGKMVVGCSTAGEIVNQGVMKDHLSLLAIAFEDTKVVAASERLGEALRSYEVGKTLAAKLAAPDLQAVFVLGPGTNVNGSALTDGMRDLLGRAVLISGGLAADETNFEKTFTILGDEITTDHVVAVGLYGEAVRVSCGSEGGWRPFGPARRVTRAEDHILYELDGKPALQLYKQYLGDKARQLPASGLSYPFAILRGDRTTSGLIRSALDIDHGREALILAGEIPQGCQVCLMHADTDALVQGAAQAAAEALRTHPGPEEGGCALLVSCVGRRLVLGIDVDDEVEAVTESFLPGTAIAGYYSYGEICSYSGTGRTELHNQTMTITYITERKAV